MSTKHIISTHNILKTHDGHVVAMNSHSSPTPNLFAQIINNTSDYTNTFAINQNQISVCKKAYTHIYSFNTDIYSFNTHIYSFNTDIYSFYTDIYAFNTDIYSFNTHIYSFNTHIYSFNTDICAFYTQIYSFCKHYYTSHKRSIELKISNIRTVLLKTMLAKTIFGYHFCPLTRRWA